MNFDTLLTDVRSLITDTSEELSAYMDTAIMLTEQRIYNRLDEQAFVSVAFTSASAGDPFLTLPADCRVIKSLNYDGPCCRCGVFRRTDEYLLQYWPDRTSVAHPPKYYALFDSNRLIVAPAATSSSAIWEMTYVSKPIHLSATNSTNWYSVHAPAALLYGTVAEGYRFINDHERAALFDNHFKEEITALMVEGARMRRDDNLPNNSPLGGENNLGDRK